MNPLHGNAMGFDGAPNAVQKGLGAPNANRRDTDAHLSGKPGFIENGLAHPGPLRLSSGGVLYSAFPNLDANRLGGVH